MRVGYTWRGLGNDQGMIVYELRWFSHKLNSKGNLWSISRWVLQNCYGNRQASLVRWQCKRIIAATSNLANCCPQNAWECLSRANKERNFAHMLKSFIKRSAFLLENSKSPFVPNELSFEIRIVVNNRLRELSWLFVEYSLPLRIQYFFWSKSQEKSRISAKYVCITFAQYCSYRA